MFGLDRLSSHELAIASRTFCLWKSVVLRSQTFEKLLDRFRESFISCDLGDPTCVTACSGNREESQDCDSRRLMLVRYV
jgi:hypothetical protein